jgi:hypothetical protein
MAGSQDRGLSPAAAFAKIAKRRAVSDKSGSGTFGNAGISAIRLLLGGKRTSPWLFRALSAERSGAVAADDHQRSAAHASAR